MNWIKCQTWGSTPMAPIPTHSLWRWWPQDLSLHMATTTLGQKRMHSGLGYIWRGLLQGLNSLLQNGCLNSTWYFMILLTFFDLGSLRNLNGLNDFFIIKTYWTWWFHSPWDQNDQFCYLFVDWIIKIQNLLIFRNISVRGRWGQPRLLFWKKDW